MAFTAIFRTLLFVNTFADAMHAIQGRLTLEITGVCRGPDEAGLSCGQSAQGLEAGPRD
jgi:hypothetical protein